jgi:hypothetical protein
MRVAANEARHQYLASNINHFVARLWLKLFGAGHYPPIINAQVDPFNDWGVERYNGSAF